MVINHKALTKLLEFSKSSSQSNITTNINTKASCIIHLFIYLFCIYVFRLECATTIWNNKWLCCCWAWKTFGGKSHTNKRICIRRIKILTPSKSLCDCCCTLMTHGKKATLPQHCLFMIRFTYSHIMLNRNQTAINFHKWKYVHTHTHPHTSIYNIMLIIIW